MADKDNMRELSGESVTLNVSMSTSSFDIILQDPRIVGTQVKGTQKLPMVSYNSFKVKC